MSIYGCYNKPRPISGMIIPVQDGYHTGPPDQRIDKLVKTRFQMSTECQYTKTHASDHLCGACIHRNKEA